jgi:hypothetical protein
MLKKDKKKSEWKPHLSVSLLAEKPTSPGPPLPRSILLNHMQSLLATSPSLHSC